MAAGRCLYGSTAGRIRPSYGRSKHRPCHHVRVYLRAPFSFLVQLLLGFQDRHFIGEFLDGVDERVDECRFPDTLRTVRVLAPPTEHMDALIIQRGLDLLSSKTKNLVRRELHVFSETPFLRPLRYRLFGEFYRSEVADEVQA